MKPSACQTSPPRALPRRAVPSALFALAAVLATLSLAPAPAQAAPVTVASQGRGAGQVEGPVGTAVDQESHDLYVADGGNFRIDKFDPKGGFLEAWGFGVADNESAELQTCGPQAAPPTIKCFHTGSTNTSPGAGNIGPEALEVDQESHDLYVADASKRRITKFTPTGGLLFLFGPDVTFSGPGDTGAAAQQMVTVKATGGSFALTLTAPVPATVNNPKAETTAAIPFNATALEVEGALEALGSVEAGDLLVSGGPGDATGSSPYLVDFTGGPFAGNEVAAMKADVTGLTGTVAVATTVQGGGLEVCEPGRGDVCKASGSGVLKSPTSLAVDSESHDVWVGDSGRIVRFDAAGGFLSQALVPGGGGVVKGLAVDPLESGDFWMKSQSLSGVRHYALSGSPPAQTLTQLGSPIDAAGEPEALVLDSKGNLYVGDKASPYRFKVYHPTGGELFSQFGAGQVIGRPGAGGGGSPGGKPLALDEAAGALYAASSASGTESAVQRFALPEEGPLPEEPRAEELLPSSATLAATLDPEGHATEYHFEYGTTTAYGSETPAKALLGSGYEEEGVSAAIEHLLPETTYHFRLLASNECRAGEQCTTHSEDATFTTPPAVAIDAQWSDEVAAASTLLKAELDPLGAPAEWRLEYGTSESYGNATGFQPLGSGIGAVAVATQITGLEPDTLYHYRFAAKDERNGVPYLVHGPGQTFLTALGVLGFSLPDGRAWEQVTPLRKAGGRIVAPWEGFTQASESGEALTFISIGPVSATEGSRLPEPAQSLARRGAGGWSSEDIEAPHETAEVLSPGTEYRLFAPDLCRAALEPRGLRVKQPGPLSGEASEWTPYLRQSCAGPVRWRPLATGREPFADVCPGTEFGGEEEEEQLGEFHPAIRVVGGSPGLGAAIVQSKVPLTCDPEGVSGDAEGVNGALYEWSEGALKGTLELVSELPNGKAAGSATLGSAGATTGSIRGAVSEGGRYVYWEDSETSPTALYVRDTAKGQTVRLDEPLPHSFGGKEAPVFQGASADGTRAFFTDTRHLTPDAGESGADLYECEIAEAGGKDECALRDLTPETPSREAVGVQGIVSGIGEEGNDLYFVANGALAPGAVRGNCADPAAAAQRCNLYHAHRGKGGSWSLRLVAVLSGADAPDWAGSNPNNATTASLAAAASPSGRYLAFMSELPLTGYDSRDAKSGQAAEEVFRYDSEASGGAGEVACVSCNPSGARPRGAVGASGYQLPSDWQGLWTGQRLAATLPDPEIPEVSTTAFYRPRAMLDDGRVLFNAFDSLVPADSNGTADAYQYEPWQVGSCTPSSVGPALAQAQGGGCVALLSSGTSERESAVLDSSATGEDVFFITASRLSVLDEDPDYDIYDARVGGIPAQREEVSECLGEACQSPAPAPADLTPASLGLRGAGNLKGQSALRRRTCPPGKRKVRHRGKAHCAKGRQKHHRQARREGGRGR